jgi:hypothetical protein
MNFLSRTSRPASAAPSANLLASSATSLSSAPHGTQGVRQQLRSAVTPEESWVLEDIRPSLDDCEEKSTDKAAVLIEPSEHQSALMVAKIAKGVKSAFPKSPTLMTTMKFPHKLRWFVGSTTTAIFITSSNFGFAYGSSAGVVASNLSSLTTSFKIKSIKVYGTVDLDSSGSEGIAFTQIQWVGARIPAVSITGIATAGVPMCTVSRPPKNSFGSMWTTKDFTDTAIIAKVTFPTYFSGILEVDCDMTLLDADHTHQFYNSTTSVTIGRIYQTNFAQSTMFPIGYYSANF